MKTAIKKFEAAAAEGKKDEALVLFKDAVKKLDQAAGRNLVHKNKAAHKKSQLALKLAKLS